MIEAFGSGEDETACASLNYRVSLDRADWWTAVLQHLDRMHAEMPDADVVVLRLERSGRPR